MNINKPKYMEDLLAIIFQYLGILFFVFGILCLLGIMTPSTTSLIQDSYIMGVIFLITGIVFCITQLILKRRNNRKVLLHNELLKTGFQVNGTVEKIYLQQWTHFGQESPYRICYDFSYGEKYFHHKSCLLWDKPNLAAGDSITVYVNHSGKSTLNL